MEQVAPAMTGHFDKDARTKRGRFPAEMEQVLPWAELEAALESHHPKGSPAGGRPPLPLPRMQRIYCLQQWYNLSDPGGRGRCTAR